ncbi:hypothetical protein NQ318_005999 [Aromia moschata]|uniref:Fibronectin type-III domain-containing protein n=1 Tax=Aromia moschata TaxID=1265417 RepID=A0AAV8XFX3_9CUCU|nr:hypothetical protein NQ318_005999 [Aromia moschata]
MLQGWWNIILTKYLPPKVKQITPGSTYVDVDWIWDRNENSTAPEVYNVPYNRLGVDLTYNITYIIADEQNSTSVKMSFTNLQPSNIYMARFSIFDQMLNASGSTLIAFMTLPEA